MLDLNFGFDVKFYVYIQNLRSVDLHDGQHITKVMLHVFHWSIVSELALSKAKNTEGTTRNVLMFATMSSLHALLLSCHIFFLALMHRRCIGLFSHNLQL